MPIPLAVRVGVTFSGKSPQPSAEGEIELFVRTVRGEGEESELVVLPTQFSPSLTQSNNAMMSDDGGATWVWGKGNRSVTSEYANTPYRNPEMAVLLGADDGQKVVIGYPPCNNGHIVYGSDL